MYSHHSIIKEIVKPGFKVLEWGSGLSTEVIVDCLKGDGDSFFVSIEHDLEWHKKRSAIDKKGVNFKPIFKATQLKFGKSQDYVSCPYEYGPNFFDFILVDGRNRADCIFLASLLLKKDGICMVHDAERRNYMATARKWFGDIVVYDTPKNKTALLKHNK